MPSGPEPKASELLSVVIPDALNGERVDRVVALLGGVSRTVAGSLVDAGEVTIDGGVVTSRSARMAVGARLEVAVPPPPPPAPLAAEPDVDVHVVYADEHVIVVDKQAGLVVHPGRGNPTGTLVHGLLARFPDLARLADASDLLAGIDADHAVSDDDLLGVEAPGVRPGIVHRLDKGTSGLLVVCRTREAVAALVGQLQARTVDRRYLALVWGHPASASGQIDAAIGRSPRDPTRMAVVRDGREARTGYEVEHRYAVPERLSRIECKLETGRTHQIRVHLTAIGHPVVGDPVYGRRAERFGLTRPFLHARQLGFEHPASGEWVSFEAPTPPELQAVLDRCADE